VTLEQEDFSESAYEYLCSKKMVWGKMATERYFQDMIRCRLRCNNMKMVWIHTGGCKEDRKNWMKISERTAENIFEKIKVGWEEVCCEISDKTECPKEIRNSKWCRRNIVLKTKFPNKLFQKKGFKRFLVNNHDDLPALR